MSMPPPPPLQPQGQYPTAQGPVPLWAPYYNAPLGEAVRRFFSKYATFSGRASRAELWWWILVAAIIGLVLNILLSVFGGNRMNADGTMASFTGGALFVSIIIGLWGLATIIPSLALVVRRLHDSDHSGWWIFIGLIPLVGSIILIVFYLVGPNPAGARFDRPTS